MTLPDIPWRPIVAWAVLGTVLAVSIVLLDVARNSDTVGGLIHTGPSGPAAALMRLDFPDEAQFANGEHDGPMVYAIARAPMHLSEVAESLDRPRYRLQHPLLPWLGWLGHPSGGGRGLEASLFVVGVLALFGGAVAIGALSTSLGGAPWLAVCFPLLPGSFMSLRITVADALGMALVLGAVTLYLRGHTWVAVVIATAAVFAKEPALLTLAGVALWRRNREAIAFVAVPLAAMLGWALWLRSQVPSGTTEVIEFTAPFRGWVGTAQLWFTGNSTLAIPTVIAALVVTALALIRRRPSHPLYWAVLLNLAFLALLDRDVIGLDRNGTRMTLPLLSLAIVALATPLAAQLTSDGQSAIAAPAAEGVVVHR